MLQVGKTYTAHNQGMNITPYCVQVTIVWINGDDVYCRLQGNNNIKQTTTERLLSLIKHD